MASVNFDAAAQNFIQKIQTLNSQKTPLWVSYEVFIVSIVEEIDYCKTSSISHTLVGNEIVDNSDVVGASPVGAAPTTSSFST